MIFDILSNLKHIGRIAQIGKSFWRTFQKGACPNITSIEVGQNKYQNSDMLDVAKSPDFIQFLALGLSWTFPNLQTITIFLAHRQLDPEVLLEVFKDLKVKFCDGQKLKRINVLQMTDISLIRDFMWTYLSLTHAGGRPIEIYVSSDAFLDTRTKNYRYFGPG
jgi:hypothetical protein